MRGLLIFLAPEGPRHVATREARPLRALRNEWVRETNPIRSGGAAERRSISGLVVSTSTGRFSAPPGQDWWKGLSQHATLSTGCATPAKRWLRFTRGYTPAPPSGAKRLAKALLAPGLYQSVAASIRPFD